MIKKYNKLVRDKIPKIIEASGNTCKTRILSDEEYIEMLDKKLNEECAEYQADKNIEELADMRFIKRCKDVNYIEINPTVFKKLTPDDVKHILAICDEKLDGYYGRLENR